MATEQSSDASHFQAVGRRKHGSARVWLYENGDGTIEVNGRKFEDYFPRETSRQIIMQPLALVEKIKVLNVKSTVTGGGISGQAAAIAHGISRALLKLDPALRPSLKKAGFLTRDSRMKERKKYGQKGARKRFQFSKR